MNKWKLQGRRLLTGLAVLAGVWLTRAAQGAEPSSQWLQLSNDYWHVQLIDTAGYSDKFYWGASPRHNVEDEHEMLSGEWGAAIYYDGIGTGNQAMWLTDCFL
jgi:hypothetical protein